MGRSWSSSAGYHRGKGGMSPGERAASPAGLAGDCPPEGMMRKWELELNA